ncbi:tail fiber protein [Nibrella viscosa]|uniref:Tail fiber protein n=1 Tax=Nibrella viscosa TaxID=1084524 RepID=A0ABP8JSE9_9BACT
MEPFLASLALFSFNFAPKGWALCNGQLLPINQNQALFSLLGTTYGGDGRVNFALPDLRGRAAMHMGSGHTLGERAGSQAVTLTIQNLPNHFHPFVFQPPCNTNAGTTADPTNNFPAATPANSYGTPANVNMGANSQGPATVTTGSVGGNQAFNNMQPYLVLSYCIALQGVFPSPN